MKGKINFEHSELGIHLKIVETGGLSLMSILKSPTLFKMLAAIKLTVAPVNLAGGRRVILRGV